MQDLGPYLAPIGICHGANARAFQFRAQLRSYQPEFNIEVTQLRVAADEVV